MAIFRSHGSSRRRRFGAGPSKGDWHGVGTRGVASNARSGQRLEATASAEECQPPRPGDSGSAPGATDPDAPVGRTGIGFVFQRQSHGCPEVWVLTTAVVIENEGPKGGWMTCLPWTPATTTSKMTNKRSAWLKAPTSERTVKPKIFRRREPRPIMHDRNQGVGRCVLGTERRILGEGALHWSRFCRMVTWPSNVRDPLTPFGPPSRTFAGVTEAPSFISR
jgi:hypothetical protein